jgi:hypothetical protein
MFLHFLCDAERLLEEILARVEDGELPDAAETEAHWSSFITTATPSIKSQTGDISESPICCGKALKTSKVSTIDSRQDTEGHSVAEKVVYSMGHRKRKLAPVDEGKNLIALHLQKERNDSIGITLPIMPHEGLIVCTSF